MRPSKLLFVTLCATLAFGPAVLAQDQQAPTPAPAPDGAVIVPEGASVLKVCKVAGEGVPIGQQFPFATKPAGGMGTVSVPAGPRPGGWCQVVGSYAPGTTVVVRELIPGGYGVDSIAVVPASAQVSQSPAKGEVVVRLPKGVTEVTVVDSRRVGYLEICKKGGRLPTYDFTYTGGDGIAHKVTVPNGACTPALEVPAGAVVIKELMVPSQISGATTWPAAPVDLSQIAAGKVIVQVQPGDLSTQTIVTIENKGGPKNEGPGPVPPR